MWYNSNNKRRQLQHSLNTCFAVMSGAVGTGHQVVQIEASDADDLGVSGVEYEIASTEYVRGSEVLKGVDNATIRHAFTIDRHTGKVCT